MKKSISIVSGIIALTAALVCFSADNLTGALVGTCCLFASLLLIRFADNNNTTNNN